MGRQKNAVKGTLPMSNESVFIPIIPVFERQAWILQHIPPQLGPIPTPMNRADPVRRVMPAPVRCHLRNIRLERRVCMAQQYLSQVSQTMLDVVCGMRPVDEVPDADDVQAVELVVERDDERAVVRAYAREPVRGEERAPFVVVP